MKSYLHPTKNGGGGVNAPFVWAQASINNEILLLNSGERKKNEKKQNRERSLSTLVTVEGLHSIVPVVLVGGGIRVKL